MSDFQADLPEYVEIWAETLRSTSYSITAVFHGMATPISRYAITNAIEVRVPSPNQKLRMSRHYAEQKGLL